jgi:uncharacterized protein
MTILDEILQTLPMEPVPVRRVTIGIHWTMVCSRYCGLASTLTGEDLPYSGVPRAGELQNFSAQQLARLAFSENHYENSIGVAAINSLICPEPEGFVELNAYDWLYENSINKDVAIVGHFPFVDKLRTFAKNLWVLEKNPRPGDIPAEKSAEYLSKAQIVAITGSSLVNHSFDEVLAMCAPGAVIMVLGPSTPLSSVMFAHGVSILSGAYVFDEEKALLAVEQCGSYSQIGGVKRVTLFKEGMK